MSAPSLSPARTHVRVDNTPLGIAMMLGSVFFMSAMSVLVKVLSATYPVVEVTFFRNAFALLPVVTALLVQNGWRHGLYTARPWGHVWRSVIGLTSMIMMFWSFHLMPIGDAVALNFSAPLFLTAMSAPLLGEKVGFHRWNAVLVGFAGVVIMVQPSGETILNAGALVALGGAFAQSFAMIAIRQLSASEPANTIVFYFTAITTAILGMALPFVWVTPTLADFGLALVMGFLGGGGQLCLTRAYSLAPAAVVAPLNYLSLLWAMLFGWFIWADVPTAHVVTGAIVVAASGLYILHRETRRAGERRAREGV